MRKNIIIGVLVVTNFLMLAFPFMQKKAADEARIMAVEQTITATENAQRAQVETEKASTMARVAETNAMEAHIKAEEAVEALRKEQAK